MLLGQSESSGAGGLGSPAAVARRGQSGTGTFEAKLGERGEWGPGVEVRSFVEVLVWDLRAGQCWRTNCGPPKQVIIQ